MSHFAKAAEILKRAAQGEILPPDDGHRECRPSMPPPRRVGNPVRLKEAYQSLWRLTLDYIRCPSDQARGKVIYQHRVIGLLEPECAPVGSPWVRPPFGKDETSFAPLRALDTKVMSLLDMNRRGVRWQRLAREVQETIEKQMPSSSTAPRT